MPFRSSCRAPAISPTTRCSPYRVRRWWALHCACRPAGRTQVGVGAARFWEELVRLMAFRDRGVDFITIDGGEGGTGAGPLVFTDHVALPFKVAFGRVYKLFVKRDLHERVVFIGSGKLGFPDAALFAFALGCDLIAIGREALLAIGCIQAQRCHTNHCPTGITTHNRWLIRGIDPTLKSSRLANYIVNLRKELLALSCACGVPHPSLVTADQLELLDGRFGSRTIADLFGYAAGHSPAHGNVRDIERQMGSWG